MNGKFLVNSVNKKMKTKSQNLRKSNIFTLIVKLYVYLCALCKTMMVDNNKKINNKTSGKLYSTPLRRNLL